MSSRTYRFHSDRIQAWVDQNAKDLPSDQLLKLFEHAFVALWARAHFTMSSVILTVILDRALFNSVERYPKLAGLKVEETGLSFAKLRNETSMPANELLEGLQYVLTEFVTITSNITGELMTPALYEELSHVVPDTKLTLIKKK